MGWVSTEVLLLVYLAGAETASGTDGGPGRSLSEIAAGLSPSRGRLSDQIELVTTLEELQANGLVTADADGRASCSDDRVRFSLTEEGSDRAASVRERLAATTIEVVGDAREELALREAAAELDRSMVEIAAALTDDGTYYRREAPEEEFVDRPAVVQRCTGKLEDVREGTGNAIFLVGPAGVGKTTLAEHLLDRTDLPVLRGRCRGEGTTPYQPLRDALADVDGPGESPFVAVGPDVDDEETYRAQRTALFSSITDRLVGEDARPRVLYLDDLHLADAATLTYLEYLLDRLADRPLALLGSYRPQELPEDAPIAARAVPPDAPVTTVDVQPFDREQTRALIERVLGRRGVPDAFADAVYDRTGGNPMFVEVAVTALLEAGDLDPDLEWYPESADEVEMPTEVRETIDRRVDGFPVPAQDLLKWAAILGEQFPEVALERVSDLSSTQLRTYVDLFVNGAILERTAGLMLQFRSEVVREALLERLPEDERRDRHATAAAALETIYPDGDDADARHVGAIAHHHCQAGNTSDAIEWYRRAAERATDVYAHDVAIEHYEQALTLARRTDDDETVLAVIEAIAGIHVTTGTYDDAERHVAFARERANETPRLQRLLRLASRIATERGDYERAIETADGGLALDEAPTRPRCQLLQQKALATLEQGNYERARETVERQLAVATELDDARLEGKALVALGWAAREQGDHDEAREHLRRAGDLLGDVDDRHGVAETHTNLGEIAVERSDYDEASDHFERAREIFRDVGDRHAVAKVHNQVGWMAWEQSEYERAREHYRRAGDIFREVGDRHGVAKTLNNRGLLAKQQSEYEQAGEFYRGALEIFRDIGAQKGLSDAFSNLGSIAWERGNYEDAREYYRQSLRIVRARGDSHSVAIRLNNIGTVAMDQGAYDEAEDNFDRALELFREVGDRRAVGKVHNNLGKLARDRGDYGEAREYHRQALEIFRDVDDRHDVAKAVDDLGAVAIERESYDEALDHLERALEGFREVDDRHKEARCLVRYGRLARETGDPATAHERGERALSILEELDATDDILEALELLVECADEAGDGDQALSWCRQAQSILAEVDSAPGGVDEEQLQWFETRRDQLRDDTGGDPENYG